MFISHVEKIIQIIATHYKSLCCCFVNIKHEGNEQQDNGNNSDDNFNSQLVQGNKVIKFTPVQFVDLISCSNNNTKKIMYRDFFKLQTSFDWCKGPLTRWLLCKCTTNTTILLVAISNSIIDQASLDKVSLDILINQFRLIYSQVVEHQNNISNTRLHYLGLSQFINVNLNNDKDIILNNTNPFSQWMHTLLEHLQFKDTYLPNNNNNINFCLYENCDYDVVDNYRDNSNNNSDINLQYSSIDFSQKETHYLIQERDTDIIIIKYNINILQFVSSALLAFFARWMWE